MGHLASSKPASARLETSRSLPLTANKIHASSLQELAKSGVDAVHGLEVIRKYVKACFH
jgi:hypothetical protein